MRRRKIGTDDFKIGTVGTDDFDKGWMRWMIYGITHLQETTEKLRETPRNSQELRETPRDSQELRETPRNSEKLRETPRNSQETPEKLSTNSRETINNSLHHTLHTTTLPLPHFHSTREFHGFLSDHRVTAPISAILFSPADVEMMNQTKRSIPQSTSDLYVFAVLANHNNDNTGSDPKELQGIFSTLEAANAFCLHTIKTCIEVEIDGEGHNENYDRDYKQYAVIDSNDWRSYSELARKLGCVFTVKCCEVKH